jgi:hypothetical protein
MSLQGAELQMKRNPKFEILNPKQARILKYKIQNIGIWDFEFV